HLTRSLDLLTVYQLEKEDNGTFFKDIFAQQLSRELESHFFDVGFMYRRIKRLQLQIGVNWYLRREWRFGDEKEKIRDYFAFSPRMTILYSIGSRLLLHLSFAPKVYRDINLATRYFETGQINLQYAF
ncbi:MAG: hypothetical protein WAN36_00100, partial [Calditrichia bacterium]